MVREQLPQQSRRRKPPVLVTIALLLSIAISSCAFPEEGFDGDLEGDYLVNGTDPRGTEYSGRLIVVATDDPDTYELQWIITGAVQEGTGVVSGDELLVEWEAIESFEGRSSGTATYLISSDGTLTGEREVGNEEGIGTEEAFPIR